MPLEAVILILLLALAAVIAAAAAASRGKTLTRLRETLRIGPHDALETTVHRVVEERDNAASRARERREDLQQLADIIGLGIIRLDEHLVVRLANRTVHLLLGRRPGSLMGATAMEAFTDHRLEELVSRVTGSSSASLELHVHAAQESTLFVRAVRSRVEGVWVVVEDISELRRLQRIRTEFLDNLSHELRTPLSTVRLLTETLSRDLETADVTPRIRERVSKIDVETGHLVQMVSELLDLSRIESGGAAQLFLDDVDLRVVVRSALDRLALFAERQGVRLATDLTPETLTVRGDEERLGQLLLNLLHNAVKFSPPGTQVTVRAGREGAEAVVHVEDQGPGIPSAEVARVFERFYKVDKARVRGRGGTGLGLAIARHIAESHGGRIWVESEEGRGSTFSFAIPLPEAA